MPENQSNTPKRTIRPNKFEANNTTSPTQQHHPHKLSCRKLQHQPMPTPQNPRTAIGIRAHPQQIWYAILQQEGAHATTLNLSILRIPKALAVPAKLRFIRTTLLNVIGEYKVTRAGIRTTEPTAQSPDTFRLNIEGVAQEVLASGAVSTYFAGPIAKIAGCLNITPRTDVKEYINGDKSYPGENNWSELKKEEREAFLAALCALALPEQNSHLATEED
uniref:hypothetical protein n=1 Tax=Corallococcus coralloides TaxID=184914 RepID=UPI000FFF5CCB|nr:hypothetical protein [Corallococcus coralloides]